MIEHRSVVNFIYGITDRIDFSSEKTILAVTTISFDIFVLETLLPLTKGLRVIIADENQQKNGEELNNLIIDNNVNIFQTTPSRIQMMLSYENSSSAFGLLDEVIVGGEELPKKLLDELKKICKGKIYNMYGPTETTIWSLIQELTHKEKVDIGRPIFNTNVYIMNQYQNLNPIGVAGELYIAGDGLARGYLNKPELTAEKFVSNPFVPGERMYRTGDLARWLPDGNIEFLGRIDNQVKIRGYRIELGEIENCLLKHELVKEAVVIAKNDESGQ